MKTGCTPSNGRLASDAKNQGSKIRRQGTPISKSKETTYRFHPTRRHPIRDTWPTLDQLDIDSWGLLDPWALRLGTFYMLPVFTKLSTFPLSPRAAHTTRKKSAG